MRNALARLLLSLSSLILALGALAHAKAFPGASRAISNANLKSIYGDDFRALWLADSATLLTVAVLFVAIAIRPVAASRFLLALIAAIPAATAILIYVFVVSLYAGHLLLGAAVAGVFAAFLLPGFATGQRSPTAP